MRRVLTYGNFDLFHWGHVEFLRRAKELGDVLIVGLSDDEFSRHEKNKITLMCFEERMIVLEACRYVDHVFLEWSWTQKSYDIQLFKIHVLVMGDDWKGKFDDLPCEVVYLERTPGISTEEIKKRLMK